MRKIQVMECFVETDEEPPPEETEQDTDVWKAIMEEFDSNRRQIEDYKRSKLSDCDLMINPTVKYLDENIFVILLDILEKTLFKAQETNSLLHHKTTFNPMDYIAEHLWNLNPKHPERRDDWVCIFDMNWAKDYLKEHPRPYFPFSWIWNKDYAALKMQSHLRGYWTRKREDVQEMRQFWKALLEDMTTAKQEEKLRQVDCICAHKGNENDDTDCFY